MFETWAIVMMIIGGLSLWTLALMFVMSIMIAASKADDILMGDKQYEHI